MKSRYFFLFIMMTGIAVLTNAQSGPPWVKIITGYNYIMRGIDFPESQDYIGFMAGESLTYMGDGIILKTTDAGATWTPLWTGINQGLEGASFPDLNNGFVAGWPKLSSGWSGFARTTNGGATWTSLPVDPNVYYFTDVVFKDANNGILLGSTNSSPRVWVTSNGGNSWTIATGVASMPAHACYLSGDTYFMVDNGGRIMKSVNNGQSWTTIFTGGGILTGIDFFDANTGMACGADGQIIKTYDGGTSWTPQLLGSNPWHDFAWESSSNVFLCGTPEVVVESTDGGTVWVNSYPQSGLQQALYECIFTANGTGFICGSGGVILKRAPGCTALFTASATNVCAGDAVTFTNQSTGPNLTFQWTFEGGSPTTSTLQDPVVNYNTAGVFDVKLIVSNGSWSDTLLKQDYITVGAVPPAPVISVSGTLLSSTSATGNIWYFNGQPIPGATGQTWNAQATGVYWDVVQQNGCLSDTSNHIYIAMVSVSENKPDEFTLTPADQFPGKSWFLRFSSSDQTTGHLYLYDVTGRLILEKKYPVVSGANGIPIDLNGFSPGIYLVGFDHGIRQFRGKIMLKAG